MPLPRANDITMKRIIICADGTWNRAELVKEESGKPTSTNVSKVAAIIARKDDKDVEQRVLYLEGVGSAQGEAITGGAFGWGLSRNISLAYEFLCRNYEAGDAIYLFGFSRGAYTVRSLAGLVCNSGVVRDLAKLHDAVSLYREKSTPDKAKSIKSRVFRNQFSHPVRIHFIGVWDTVGAMGLPLIRHSFAKALGWEWDFHDTRFDEKIDNAYHALALDERRSNFRPVLHGTPDPGHNIVERWFRGVHSDVGGGYRETGLSNITLRWMVENAKKEGLAIVENWEEFLGIGPDTLTDNLMTGRDDQLDPKQFARHEEWKGFFKLLDQLCGRQIGFIRSPQTGIDASVEMLSEFYRRGFIIWADQYWNDTEFPVLGGQIYSITVIGHYGVKDANIAVDGVHGVQKPSFMQRSLAGLKRSKEQNYMRVIGSLDRETETYFALDAYETKYRAPKDGKLSFFLNDVPLFYWNNLGYVSLRISLWDPENLTHSTKK